MLKKALRLILLTLILVGTPILIYRFNHDADAKRSIASESLSDTDFPEQTLTPDSPNSSLKAFKFQILHRAALESSSEGPGVSLGNLKIVLRTGESAFFCEKYKVLDFVFAAEGVSYSGEIPKMIVRGPCLVNSDETLTEALPIPFARIFELDIATTELSFSVPTSPLTGKIFFKNVYEEWPKEWTWVGVTLYSETPGENIDINGYEIIYVRGAPVVLKP